MRAPDPVAFSIFGLDIMWYGLLIGIGFMLAVIISYMRAPKYGIDPDFILTLTIWIIPSAVIGARLYYVIFSWDDFPATCLKFSIQKRRASSPRRLDIMLYRQLLRMQTL